MISSVTPQYIRFGEIMLHGVFIGDEIMINFLFWFVIEVGL